MFPSGDAGMASFSSPFVRGVAARIQVARSTCTWWPAELADLYYLRWEFGPLIMQSATRDLEMVDNRHWSSRAFADTLAVAAAVSIELPYGYWKGMQAAIARDCDRRW